MKRFAYIVSAVVAAAVVAGFWAVGSPLKERARRFDERRVNDLQMIQSNILHYWQFKRRLPRTLDELRDRVSGFGAPRDPETDAAYEYIPSGPLSFTLCAAFAMDSEDQSARPYYDAELWRHNSGRACFERTIDPELYPPAQPVPGKPIPID